MNFKDLSKQNFATKEGEKPTYQQIELGCLQRMADSSEAMAANHVRIENDLKMYKRRFYDMVEQNEALRRTNRGLKSYVTRLRNQKK